MLEFLLDKAAGLSFAALLKKRLWHRRFPVNFAKFLRTIFFIEHFTWLLLRAVKCYKKFYAVRCVKSIGDSTADYFARSCIIETGHG